MEKGLQFNELKKSCHNGICHDDRFVASMLGSKHGQPHEFYDCGRIKIRHFSEVQNKVRHARKRCKLIAELRPAR